MKRDHYYNYITRFYPFQFIILQSYLSRRMQLMWIDVSFKESVCTIRFSGKTCGSLRSGRICLRPLGGNNRRMTLQIDRWPSRATRISFPRRGETSPFFFYVYFSVPPRHFSRPSCRYSALKRVSSKRPPFLCRGFPFKRHSDIASSSSWSAQIFLE